ncbi:MAG: HAD hydrolase-like protein [Candidatus Nanohaloarchaea archaeon]|nr:HAD hydrolase-like protein [Candidatus Nanohaloarchaea archaeon]
MTEAVVLDFDGTLYRDRDSAYEAFQEAVLDLLRDMGRENPERIFREARRAVRNRRYTTTQMFLEAKDIPRHRFAETVYPAVCEVAAQTDRSRIIDAFQDEGYRVDVLTNNSERLVELYLDRQGREAASIIGASSLPVPKPQEEAFTFFIRQAPYSPEAAVYVDDEEENTAVAASMGMDAHHIEADAAAETLTGVIGCTL